MKSVLAKIMIFNKMLHLVMVVYFHKCSAVFANIGQRHDTILAVCPRNIYVSCCYVVNVLQVVFVNKI